MPFTDAFVAHLTKALTGSLVGAVGRTLRRFFQDPERAQALTRCSEAGIVSLIQAAQSEDETEQRHFADVIRDFFTSEEIADDLGRAVARLLVGAELDLAEMRELFEDTGYEAKTLPGFDFDRAFTAFAGGFTAAAIEHPILHGEIQTHLLFSQLRLQEEMRDVLREVAVFLSEAKPGSAAVSAGKITAESVVGTQIVFSSPALHPSRPPADWESHYLRTLIHLCDPLDLSPIDGTHPSGGRGADGAVRLSDVFTSLRLVGLTRRPSQSVTDALEGRRSEEFRQPEKRPGQPEGKEELAPITALEAVGALPRLVVLGRPGGGKSTLVNHLSSQLAKRRLGQSDPEKLPGFPPELRPLPVRVVLRHLASWLPEDETPADAGDVWSYLEHQLERSGCCDAFAGLRDTLIHEGGVIFFDGLDEVREDDARCKRSSIRDSIVRFSRPLEKCQVVVTCREYAYGRGDAWRLPTPDFPVVVTLAPFDLEQVRSFTTTWYQVIGPSKGWDEVRCGREAAQLSRAVEGWPHLRSLAESPLLLTLMAQIHGRDGYLPRDRADLYERTVQLLLAHWENRLVRDLRSGSTVEPERVLRLDLHTDVLRSALEKVAFEAHERQENEPSRSESAADVPVGHLLHALDEHLGSLDRARDVITYLQERAGLLQAIDGRTYRFPHRTFQEYLSARYLLKQPEYDEMLRDRVRRNLPWWRETFLLASGASRETPRMVSDLVDQLIPKGPQGVGVDPRESERARLAAQALAETRFFDRVEKEKASEGGRFTATHKKVVDWLLRAISATESLEGAERSRCGFSLATLGDPRREVLALDSLELCLVPAGAFWMGSEEYEDEKPLHRNEHLTCDYWIARFPVTTAQFRQYVEAGGRKPEDPDALLGPDNTPVVWVSWEEALDFCRWLSREWWQSGLLPEGWEVGLPSEAEWEKAVRGGIEIPTQPVKRAIMERFLFEKVSALAQVPNPDPQRPFPWLGTFDKNLCNGMASKIHSTSAVGCFPNGMSPYGCEEMSGNVWEWTRSLHQNYPYDPSDGREADNETHAARVLRGGSYIYGAGLLRSTARLRFAPALRSDNVGFRVVISPSGL